MSDPTARLEVLGADIEECDASHDKILTRLEDSLDVGSLDIHLEGLRTRRYDTLYLAETSDV